MTLEWLWLIEWSIAIQPTSNNLSWNATSAWTANNNSTNFYLELST
jgi:hypothetical protein